MLGVVGPNIMFGETLVCFGRVPTYCIFLCLVLQFLNVWFNFPAVGNQLCHLICQNEGVIVFSYNDPNDLNHSFRIFFHLLVLQCV